MYEIKKWFEIINWHCTDEEYQQALTFFSSERTYVREQFEKLSWNADLSEQENAINYLSINLFPWEYIYLILADKYSVENHKNKAIYFKHRTGKERWENAAKTIVQIGWPKVHNVLVPLFMWLLDPNWPGSELIYDFLLTLPEDVFLATTNEITTHAQNNPTLECTELNEIIAQLKEER